jgi:hypothetical protein
MERYIKEKGLNKIEQQKVNKVMSDIYSHIEKGKNRKNKYVRKLKRIHDIFSHNVQAVRLVSTKELLDNPKAYSVTDKYFEFIQNENDVIEIGI